MFNSMKRRVLKEESKKIGSDGFGQLPDGRSMRQPEVEGDADTFRVNHFLKETAVLRGQIEIEHRMNPDQEAQLSAIAEYLGIEPPLDENYRKFRELWAAENGEQVYLAPPHWRWSYLGGNGNFCTIPDRSAEVELLIRHP